MNFYVLNIVYAIVSIFVYILFRVGVGGFLRYNKNSKTFIRKNTKGTVNYWTLKKLNTEVNLGYIYYLNMALIILTSLYFIFSISLGWLDMLKLPIAILNIVLCCVQLPSIVFSSYYTNIDLYGKPFVILAKSKSGRGYHSSFFDIVTFLGVIVLSVYNFILAI